jgi:hypothetical protein
MKAANTRKSDLNKNKNIPITFRWRREIQDFEWDRKICRYVMAVSFILERHADADGKNVYPSNGTIADIAKIGIAKVREALKAMEDAGFIRTYGKTRYGTKLRRLVYKNHDIEVGDARSTSKSQTRSTTKRTQGTLGSPTKEKSLSRSARSPSATVATRSATSKPIISAPKVEGDLVDLYRKENQPAIAKSDLQKMMAQAKSVVTKSDVQLAAEWQRIERQLDLILAEFIKFGMATLSPSYFQSWGFKDPEVEIMFEAVYNDFELFSLVCKSIQPFDRKEWDLYASLMKQPRIMNESQNALMKSFWTSTAVRAFEMFIDAIKRHPDLYVQLDRTQTQTNNLDSLTVAQIRDRFYLVSELVVKDIREAQRREDLARMAKWDAEHQARQARANADAVSVSATNTGSDRMIVEKIVQTISEKVDKKELERW